jgi:hypothetical protein
MTPLIPSWEDRYRWLVGHHEVLRLKAQDGEFDPDEWHDLIKQMKGNGMHGMANDLRREMDNYEPKENNE